MRSSEMKVGETVLERDFRCTANSESGKTLWFWIIQLLKYKIRECCNKEKTKISQKTDVVL